MPVERIAIRPITVEIFESGLTSDIAIPKAKIYMIQIDAAETQISPNTQTVEPFSQTSENNSDNVTRVIYYI